MIKLSDVVFESTVTISGIVSPAPVVRTFADKKTGETKSFVALSIEVRKGNNRKMHFSTSIFDADDAKAILAHVHEGDYAKISGVLSKRGYEIVIKPTSYKFAKVEYPTKKETERKYKKATLTFEDAITEDATPATIDPLDILNGEVPFK